MRITGWLAMAGMALAGPLAAKDQAATLWRGGTIITMDGETPTTAEAVVEREGKVLFVGSEAAARAAAGERRGQEELERGPAALRCNQRLRLAPPLVRLGRVAMLEQLQRPAEHRRRRRARRTARPALILRGGGACGGGACGGGAGG